MVGPNSRRARRRGGALARLRRAGFAASSAHRLAPTSRRCRSQHHVSARHTNGTTVAAVAIAEIAVFARRKCTPNVSSAAQARAASGPYRHSAASFAMASRPRSSRPLTFRIRRAASTVMFPICATLVFPSRRCLTDGFFFVFYRVSATIRHPRGMRAANHLIHADRNILTHRGIDLRYGDVARNGRVESATRRRDAARAAL